MIGTASDMMTKQVISVKYDDTLKKAIQVLAEKNISGLPVVNDEGMVIGIITESDIVKFSGKLHVVSGIGSSGWINPYTEVDSKNSVEKGVEILDSTQVHQVMNKSVLTVNASDPGTKVIAMIGKKDINRVPVVDENNVLVGIIARSDIIRYLAQQPEIDLD
ncbi:MAG: HPP family protein [Anaerofustis sp.]|jgi:CBS-domain-containing membrane protein